MLIRKHPLIPSSEITDESTYLRRREFMRIAGTAALLAAAGPLLGCSGEAVVETAGGAALEPQSPLTGYRPRVIATDEKLTSFDDVTSYNNFYEFGTDKEDPGQNAGTLRPRPWTVAVEGLVKKPASYDIDDFLKSYALEERIYRMRCVEAWSMVIPWIGIPLADVIKRLEPLPSAKFIEFTTLYNVAQMPGQRRTVLRWPYVEALRLDEAMNPLAILGVGLYGEVLPNQNGAPIRLIVPWKYGFKSGKSIVKIRFVDTQPRNTWQVSAPNEYGFYANVNPNVDHPRWSQASERRLGEFRRRRTEMFNGYGDQVASLYTGLDLTKNY